MAIAAANEAQRLRRTCLDQMTEDRCTWWRTKAASANAAAPVYAIETLAVSPAME